jgi:molybdopterin-synthase adenylyltransferase
MLKKPLIVSSYSIWTEPPDDEGDEVLRIVSDHRSIKMKGHAFREFKRVVVPLLDGTRSQEEVHAAAADVFEPADIDAALDMLQRQGVLVEAEDLGLGPEASARLMPQLNFFHDMAPGAAALQRRLATAHVAVFGIGGAGASVAQGLASAGVGQLTLVDAGRVDPADPYLSPAFDVADIGGPRVGALAARLGAVAPETKIESREDWPESEDLTSLTGSADLVLVCLDGGLVNMAYKLARTTHASGTRMSSAAALGSQVVVGPTVLPGETSCYVCYRMRSIAATSSPESAFAVEKHFDRTKEDRAAVRQNLGFGIGIAAQFLGLEAMKLITGFAPPALAGRVLTVDLMSLETQRHTVLRKPWCPNCQGGESGYANRSH